MYTVYLLYAIVLMYYIPGGLSLGRYISHVADAWPDGTLAVATNQAAAQSTSSGRLYNM